MMNQPSLVHSGTPPDVPASADCAIRNTAWQFGKGLMPQRGTFKTLYDALQLGACNTVPLAEELDVWAPTREPWPLNQPVLVVDGSSTRSSTDFATVHEAVEESRALRRRRSDGATIKVTILVRSGTFHLHSTLILTAEDSGLTIRSHPENREGAHAILSAGKPLKIPGWKPSESPRCPAARGCLQADLSGQGIGSIRGLRLGGARQIRARYPNFDPEIDRVIDSNYMVHDGYQGWIRSATNWVGNGSHGMNGVPGPWPPTKPATEHVINASHWPSVDWPMHILSKNGTKVDPSDWTGEGDWGQYWIGVGGTCVDRAPAAGYWCAPNAPRKISTPNHPVGLRANASQLPNLPYANATGAIVHSWRPGHWYTNMFEVGSFGTVRPPQQERRRQPASSASAADFQFNFSRGGFQGGEGVTDGEAWYIENVLEEIDMPREWFYDEGSQRLYYKPNGTDTASAGPSPTDGFVATSLEVLINISGTMAAPVRNVRIEGLVLRDTVYTYLEPHGLPSGGDWALQRQGAITLAGTEGVQIASNLFTDLDGNAIFAGGYHRGLTIEANEFVGIGDTAIAAWGDTSECLSEDCALKLPAGVKMGPDARGGEQPHGTVVRGNLCREIGLWQKQSSLYFQAVAANTTVEGNVFFNGPRAALNFNDGAFGGDVVARNLFANTCRESSDHGPWNSWDRVPYITTNRNGPGGQASIVPRTRQVHHNFWIGNYNSQEAMDTDDGSAYIHTFSNVFAYAANGLKSDFGGHDHVWEKNLLLYVNNCYGAGFTTFIWPWPGYNDGFFNNTCIFRSSYESTCGRDESFPIHSNRVFSKNGSLSVCTWPHANESVPFAKWQQQGHDTKTRLRPWPSDAVIVAEAKAVLGM